MIVQNIRKLCAENGISVAMLEHNTGLSINTIYRWDSNKPCVDKVMAVADYFGVSVEDLIRGNYETNKEAERG